MNGRNLKNSISFIILHYNQKKEIWKLFKSIYFYYKENNNIELIICDDGSNKDNQKFLLELEKKYKFIKVILKTNNTKNQSLLRNQGIKVATKEYLVFIDGDDYLYYDNFKKIKLKKEVYFFNTFKIKNNIFLNNLSDHISPNNFVIKKDFLIKNNLFYEEKKFNWWSEDFYFGILILENSKYIRKDFFICIMSIHENNSYLKKYKDIKYIKYLNDLFLKLNKKIKKEKKKLKEFYLFERKQIDKFK